MLLHDVPPAPALGGVGGPFVEHLGHAVGQRPVDDVGVAGHPADVGGAPVDVGLRLQVEDRPVRVRRPDQVAAGGVQDALGLPGRAGGVHDVERVLGVESLRGVLGGGAAHGVVPPDVDPVGPRVLRQVLTGAAYDEHVADGVPLLLGLAAGLVDGRLEGGGRTAAVAAVRGDHDLGLAVDQTGGQGVGGEAAEDHRVGSAQPGAGQHRHDRLGDHRHVDRDPVTGLDAQVDQGVGGLGDLVLQLGVGDVALVVDRLTDEVQRDPVPTAGLDVPVDAVVRRVQLPADVPLGEGRVVPVEDAVPAGVPGQALGLFGPETLPVLLGSGVGLLGEVRVGGQFGGWLEPAVLLEEVGQGVVAHGFVSSAFVRAGLGCGLDLTVATVGRRSVAESALVARLAPTRRLLRVKLRRLGDW